MEALDCLPSEIVQQILTFINEISDLYQCVLVNKRFYLSAIPLLWHSPTEIGYGTNEKTRPATSVLHCLQQVGDSLLKPNSLGHHIRILCITDDDEVEDFISLLALTPLVQDLTLHLRDDITDTEMKQIIDYCPQLTTLNIAIDTISCRSIEYLGTHRPLLQHLFLSSLTDLTADTLESLQNCPLKLLDISNCTAGSIPIARSLPSFIHMTHLSLTFSSLDLTMDFACNLFLTHKVALPDLVELYLMCDEPLAVTDLMLIPFIKSHGRLKTLLLSECNITDDSLIAIATYSSRLEELYLYQKDSLSERFVRQVIVACRQLSRLSLSGLHIAQEWFQEIDPDRAQQLDQMDLARIRQYFQEKPLVDGN